MLAPLHRAPAGLAVPGLVLAIGLLSGLALLPGALAQAPETAPESLILANDYIAIVVNAGPENAGRFSVNTTGGDPVRDDDNNKPLIYGTARPGPWTSYTTVRVDGRDYVFGASTTRRAGRRALYGEEILAPVVVDRREIRAAYRLADVEVNQILSFATSVTTGLPDTARVEYRITNRGQDARRVGLRIVLDTMLGANDGAPFRVGEQALTTDAVFRGVEIPDFFQAFDSLADPQVTSQGTLRGSGATVPDAVYFTNWGSLADGAWEFDFSPGRDYTRRGELELDSAVALYWEPALLMPGETRTYVTFYGLAGITIVPGHLSLGVTSPARVAGSDTEAVSFPVVAYVENTGEGEAREVSIGIRLPQGLSLAPGERPQRNLGNLAVGQSVQVTWRVQAARGATGDFTYRVRVESINSDPNQVERTVQVVAPATLQATLEGPDRLDVVNEQWAPVPFVLRARVTNRGGTPADHVTAALVMPVGLRLAPGDTVVKPLGTLGTIPTGESDVVEWRVMPTGEYWGARLPASVKLEAAPGVRITPAPTHFVSVPPLEGRIGIVLTGQQSAGGEFRPGTEIFARIVASNVRQLYGAALELRFDPAVLQVIAGPLGVDKGDLFIKDHGTEREQLLNWYVTQVDNARGIIRLAADRGDDGALVRASGAIATVRFRARSAGQSRLVLEPWTGNPYLVGTEGEVLGTFFADGRRSPIHVLKEDGVVLVGGN